ncbi:uncharacterized protein DUF3618 [Haloactinopolyspora alba]|uniref:Uncharacterized protein DUF3618 n=1 Tax=Haloactinopolyspora alba TaxID=648780 RepID=A0A2P8D6Y8_9ACTN|nr:DUF3618 domain-containing protein [Haloactinopolyspora alba]PSK92990.1 uncharacterized protein DUF3618 [Haloactinopolyspora alba]
MNSTDPALPASRQAVPVSQEVQAEIDRKGRSAAQIERDIAQRTERLSATVDELVDRVAPARLAKDGAAEVKSRVLTPAGRPRPEIIGALVGAAVAAGLVLWRSRRG